MDAATIAMIVSIVVPIVIEIAKVIIPMIIEAINKQKLVKLVKER